MKIFEIVKKPQKTLNTLIFFNYSLICYIYYKYSINSMNNAKLQIKIYSKQ